MCDGLDCGEGRARPRSGGRAGAGVRRGGRGAGPGARQRRARGGGGFPWVARSWLAELERAATAKGWERRAEFWEPGGQTPDGEPLAEDDGGRDEGAEVETCGHGRPGGV